jgi:Xaa-Pro aminopeptidase
MSEDLIAQKLEQAVEILREQGVDCWLTFVRETAVNGDPMVPFLVPGHLTWHSALLVSARGEKIAIVGSLDRKAVEDLKLYDQVIGYVEGIRKPFQEVIRALAPKTLAVNFSRESEIADGLTHGMYLLLLELLNDYGYQGQVISSEPVVSSLRARKTPVELQRMQHAIDETLEIFEAVRSLLRPGISEAEIAQFVHSRAKELGRPTAWDPDQCPAVFTGPDTAEAHYRPTGRQVEAGHVMNMDFGLKVDGYCSDLQRTYFVPEDPDRRVPEAVQHGFDTIVTAIEKARLSMRPGVRGCDIDAVARSHVVAAGYESFPHALGHQVGRFAHDGTALLGPTWEKYASKPLLPLEAGMVFTLEPRLRVANRGTVTIEEMVVVTEDGARFLSNPQKQLWIGDFA